MVAASVSAGLLLYLALPTGGAGGHPLVPSGAVSAGSALRPGSEYVVRPGDSLWSIASRMDPSGDPRPVVAELASEVGGDAVSPGERLHLP